MLLKHRESESELSEDSTVSARPSLLAHAGIALLLCLAAGVYFSYFAFRGWIPSDEGLLGHSAERLLEGELPHRDFDDAYTGGLTYLHAAAFKLLGINLASLRVVLLIAAALFVPATYWLAARSAPWWVAILVSVTCAVWSVPNYFASMPSWYNLFFAVFGILALEQYIDTRRWSWLFVAGLCGGLSLLMKIVALYYIGAVCLFLVYSEQQQDRHSGNHLSGRVSAGIFVLTAVISLSFVGLVLLLIRHDLGLMELVTYVVPTIAVCTVLFLNEARSGATSLIKRLRALTVKTAVFAAGVAVPVVVFAIPFVVGNAFGDLCYGVFVLPHRRFTFQVEALHPLASMVPVAIPALLIGAGCLNVRASRVGRACLYGAIGLCAVLLLLYGRGWYYWNVYSLRGLLPVIATGVCIVLATRSDASLPSRQREELFLLTAVSSTGCLIQYPFAALIYFCYCAPLILLCVNSLFSAQSWPSNAPRVGLMSFYFLFAILFMNRGYGTDPRTSIVDHRHELPLDRSGLRLHTYHAKQYAAVISLIHKHSTPGSFIYAAPDCPEIYYLSNRRNPTRTMYDFFGDLDNQASRIQELIQSHKIDLIVINTRPQYSPKIEGELAKYLLREFPHRTRIGNLVVGVREEDKSQPRPSVQAARRATEPIHAKPNRVDS